MKVIRCVDTGEKVKTYEEYMITKHWEKLRSKYFKRHSRICAKCGSRELVQLHHITYRRLGEEKPTDLIPLCKNCHHELHNKAHEEGVNPGRKATNMFLGITPPPKKEKEKNGRKTKVKEPKKVAPKIITETIEITCSKCGKVSNICTTRLDTDESDKSLIQRNAEKFCDCKK